MSSSKRERCILSLKERNIANGCKSAKGNGTKHCPNVFAVCSHAVPKAQVSDAELAAAGEALRRTIEV